MLHFLLCCGEPLRGTNLRPQLSSFSARTVLRKRRQLLFYILKGNIRSGHGFLCPRPDENKTPPRFAGEDSCGLKNADVEALSFFSFETQLFSLFRV